MSMSAIDKKSTCLYWRGTHCTATRCPMGNRVKNCTVKGNLGEIKQVRGRYV